MKRKTPPSPVERRTSRRVYPSRSARLVDISPGGLTLETAVPVKKGGVYDLILRLEEHRIPVSGRVLRLERVGKGVVRASITFERLFDADRVFLEQVLVREVAERMTVILR